MMYVGFVFCYRNLNHSKLPVLEQDQDDSNSVNFAASEAPERRLTVRMK